MSFVPLELVTEILSWLPVVDVIRFKCICKLWYSIIKDPHFIKLHRRHSIQTNGDHILTRLRTSNQVSLQYYNIHTCHLGPSNKYDAMLRVHLPLYKYKHYKICHDDGVVCFGEECFKDFVLWNPLIDKGKNLGFNPLQILDPELRFIHRVDIGFGYDEVSDDYKAVRVVDFCSDEKSWYTKASASEVSVVSLKNNRCRRVQDWPFDQWRSDDFGVSVSFNGALHYCTKYWWGSAISTGVLRQPVIVVFNLTKEEFIVQEIPPFIFQNKTQTQSYSTGLSVLEGHLSLHVNCLNTHEVWIIKERGGAYDTWTKLYFIEENNLQISFRQCKPIFVSKIDGVDRVLLVASYFCHHFSEDCCEVLYWYDLRSKTYERYEWTAPDGDHWFVCLGSLHLDDGGHDLQKLISAVKTWKEEAPFHTTSSL